MVLYEKAVSSLTTSGGAFTSMLGSIFVGSVQNTLGESVLRQKIVYNATFDGSTSTYTIQRSGGQKTTKMKSHVVNITGLQDFELSRMNDEAAQLTNAYGQTLAIPSAEAAEIAVESPANPVLTQTQITNPDGMTIPTFAQGITDLATLYSSIVEGTYTRTVTNDVPGTLDPVNAELTFNGTQGTPVASGMYDDLTTKGTVEAWVYIDTLTDTAGIVHKGIQHDFSDEAYSLQFYGNLGQIAFATVKQGPYDYDLVTSSLRLTPKKWYYLVGTWDTTIPTKTIKLYVNGAQNASATMTKCLTGAYPGGGPLIIGSQYMDLDQSINGYYGFNGKINGVKVSNTAKSASDILSDYNTYKGSTSSW
jgi:hypothetical protein